MENDVVLHHPMEIYVIYSLFFKFPDTANVARQPAENSRLCFLQQLVSIKKKKTPTPKLLITMNDWMCLRPHLHASKDESNEFKLRLLQ